MNIVFPAGWSEFDNSGDGGDFGFHIKPLFNGKIFVGISTSGLDEIHSDFLFRVTDYPVDSVSVMLCFYWFEDYRPVTIEEFIETDVMGGMEKAELFFRNTSEALAFLNWVPMFMPK